MESQPSQESDDESLEKVWTHFLTILFFKTKFLGLQNFYLYSGGVEGDGGVSDAFFLSNLLLIELRIT